MFEAHWGMMVTLSSLAVGSNKEQTSQASLVDSLSLFDSVSVENVPAVFHYALSNRMGNTFTTEVLESHFHLHSSFVVLCERISKATLLI